MYNAVARVGVEKRIFDIETHSCPIKVYWLGIEGKGKEQYLPHSLTPIYQKHADAGTVGPSYLQGSESTDSMNHGLKILKNKSPESSQKLNLNLLHSGNYLHSIYIIFTIIYIAFTLY